MSQSHNVSESKSKFTLCDLATLRPCDFKLIKSCLLGLDDSNNQKSLVEQDKIGYYKHSKLQMSALIEKISAMEQYTMDNGLL